MPEAPNPTADAATNPSAAPTAAPSTTATAGLPAGPPVPPSSRRRPALLVLSVVVLLAALGATAWWVVFERGFESTDNAYVQAPTVQITPQVAGTVVEVLVDDTDRVGPGQTLVRLDPSDAQLALERAEAQLAQTVREVHAMYAQQALLQSGVRQREAEVARVQADVARITDDLARRRPLLDSGAISAEELQHTESALAGARNTLAAARAAVAAAQEQALAQQALTLATPIDKHPGIDRAAGAVREALLAVQRGELPAPVAGQVARRSVQVGQRVAPGGVLMSLVALDQAWVEANFKEVQLRHLRVGQPATLHADVYGRQVSYRGRVAGLGAGTGAAFALLPAQNATGNWIKVVQRVPVRIELDPGQLAEHPLRVGLSMQVRVDVSDTRGTPVQATAPAAHPGRPSNRTEAFRIGSDAIERRVQEIIARNLGRPLRVPAAPPLAHAASPARGAAQPGPARP